jgi:hypothetical protein
LETAHIGPLAAIEERKQDTHDRRYADTRIVDGTRRDVRR